jgi:F0F1-type ATP synthase delta subunit
MPVGPGKYDHLVTLVRKRAKAETVVLLVIDGEKGSGFSVQSHSEDLTRSLPMLLRRMADEIEKDMCPGENATQAR